MSILWNKAGDFRMIPFESILLEELKKMSEEEKRRYGIMTMQGFISFEELEERLKKGQTLKTIMGE